MERHFAEKFLEERPRVRHVGPERRAEIAEITLDKGGERHLGRPLDGVRSCASRSATRRSQVSNISLVVEVRIPWRIACFTLSSSARARARSAWRRARGLACAAVSGRSAASTLRVR